MHARCPFERFTASLLRPSPGWRCLCPARQPRPFPKTHLQRRFLFFYSRQPPNLLFSGSRQLPHLLPFGRRPLPSMPCRLSSKSHLHPGRLSQTGLPPFGIHSKSFRQVFRVSFDIRSRSKLLSYIVSSYSVLAANKSGDGSRKPRQGSDARRRQQKTFHAGHLLAISSFSFY